MNINERRNSKEIIIRISTVPTVDEHRRLFLKLSIIVGTSLVLLSAKNAHATNWTAIATVTIAVIELIRLIKENSGGEVARRGNDSIYLNSTKCTGCLECAHACPGEGAVFNLDQVCSAGAFYIEINGKHYDMCN